MGTWVYFTSSMMGNVVTPATSSDAEPSAHLSFSHHHRLSLLGLQVRGIAFKLGV
jgi:hypothetical protein